MRSLEPQRIDDRNWYYEDAHAITFVHEVILNGVNVRTDQVSIPARALAKSLERMGYVKVASPKRTRKLQEAPAK
jgi:hypothetical protein